jgi:hypothetical protein
MLQTSGTVGHRQQMAGRCVGSVRRRSGGSTTGQYGDKSQQGGDSHRIISLRRMFGMALSSSFAGKTKLAFVDGNYQLNEW